MINVKNLEFIYSNSGKKAVKNISFKIDNGEIFGFLGPSGAGKTTTQRLLIGLLEGYTGSIDIMDKERSNWNKSFFENVGVAFDFPNLYLKLTGIENLTLISSYYKNKPKNLNSLFEMVGLEKDKNQKVEAYSKGMKMRLNFIRSIMHDPDIMFFDEPTSGLDPVNAKIVKDTILKMKKNGKTIFLTTHNMTVAEQLCDRVSFIDNGNIITTDSPQNLMIKHGKSIVDISYLDKAKRTEKSFDIDGIGFNKEFIDITKNKKIITMHSKEATLEDIFIKLTGRGLM